MNMRNFWSRRGLGLGLAVLLVSTTGALPALTAATAAQITNVDPNDVLDADLRGQADPAQPAPAPDAPTDYIPPSATPQTQQPPVTGYENSSATIDPNSDLATSDTPATGTSDPAQQAEVPKTTPIPTTLPTSGSQTYKKDDLIGAAEGVFGKGAQGVAQMIQDLLAKQGEPNGYIVGREASGALVVGLRYGAGRLYHKVEGEREVYWTGPSVGFDTGGNASRSFVLVYNLYDTQDLYKRFPAGEGNAYMVGGLTASYLRRGDVVLIPIRMGVGMRLGLNAGYMKFTEKRKWLPF